MSTPESSKTTDRETSSRERQEGLTASVGRQLDKTEPKAPWWKRMLGRG